jgi:DNA uptake protein ComE-like DNA-binding protein
MEVAPLPGSASRPLARRYVRALSIFVSVLSLVLLAGAWRAGVLFPRAFDVAGPVVVDLNRDDAATIAMLPGVGKELALRIVAAREARGAFASEDALLLVDGVSVGLVKRIAPYIAPVRDEGWLGKSKK